MKFTAALLFIVAWLAIAPAVAGSTYAERIERGRALTAEINARRLAMDRNHLKGKYLLYKVADIRAEQRADEYDATGTPEFPHDLGPVQRALARAGWCYLWVGEVVGYSNQLNTSLAAATADGMVDRWWASSNHYPILSARNGRWGGGSWHISESGVYFFAYYVVDPC